MGGENKYTAETSAWLEQFGNHYNYDITYLSTLLDESPDGMKAFQGFSQSMGQHTGSLSNEVKYVAALASMYSEDCGECAQLNVRMALEAGVSEEIVRGALQMGGSLTPELELVRRFAYEVASNQLSEDIHQKMLDTYDKNVIADLSICIAANRVYPAMKRALGKPGTSCKILDFEFAPPSGGVTQK